MGMKFPLKLIKNVHSSSDISYLLIDANKENILSMKLPDTLEVEEIIRRANEYDYLAKEVIRLEQTIRDLEAEVRALEEENKELRCRRD